ncbi:MAG: hypothetical protein WAT79_02990 [Saprospiraceae bacterium]
MLMMTLFMLSCQREDVKKKPSAQDVFLENRTVTDCEPPSMLDCYLDTVLRVVHMDFFDCDMGIEYERYICTDGGYYFGNFRILAEDCDSFDTWINNCMSSLAGFELCMEFLNGEIMKTIIIDLLNFENPPSPTVALTFYQAACNQWCLTSPYNPRDEYFYVLGKLRCSNACCQHSYTVKKFNGEWVIIDETKTQVGGIGCEYQLQVDVCEDGIYTSSCINECQ